MDPHCPHTPPLPTGITSRPVGKLYMDPRPWCDCGARVLEVYTCRNCGLLYLGDIPDDLESLWPWADDFSGERRNEDQFRIFGVEALDAYARASFRSTRTTLPTHEHGSSARPVYEVNDALDESADTRPFPDQCPRCHSYSQARFQEHGREVIENLKTKGSKTFSAIVEDGFRVQPQATDGIAPNYGRKELLFTDAPDLYVLARRGKLFLCNKGPVSDFPGFLICPDCGRALDPDTAGSHTYPNHIPPFAGKFHGPYAGDPCPNTTRFTNQVILGHDFYSEVVQPAVRLPGELDAPYATPAGQAVWQSFGHLVTNAAARVLQIDQSELQVGVRAVYRESGRLQGEIYIYDNVPGGAGYARAIEQNLKDIVEKALELAEQCSNLDCHGACYYCILDRQNQNYHPLLDRTLGAAVLRYLLHGEFPVPDQQKVQQGAAALAEYAHETWEVLPGREVHRQTFACILRNREKEEVGLWVIHPLQARPSQDDQLAFLNAARLRCAVHTTFDLERRPFWSVNNLVGGRV